MNDNLPIPRMAERVRSWAALANDRSCDDGADVERWSSISDRLYHAAELFEASQDDQAAAIVDGVVGDLLRGDR